MKIFSVGTKVHSAMKRIMGTKQDYSKRSFSQCGEDLIMDHIFQALRIERPSYLDIGAHHPQHFSNTSFFYSKGSRGINIEPDPALFEAFLADRREDINLNIGVAAVPGEADLYIMNQPALNTFIKEEANRVHHEHPPYIVKEVRRIPMKPVSEIIQQYWNGSFPDFLTIDVEGMDEEIIRSINYDACAPKIICAETLRFSPQRRWEKKTELIDFLKQKGYFTYADTYINTIFMRKEIWFE